MWLENLRELFGFLYILQIKHRSVAQILRSLAWNSIMRYLILIANFYFYLHKKSRL